MVRISLIISVLLNIVLLFIFASDKIHLRKKEQANIVMFGNSLTAYGNWQELLNRKDVQNSGCPGFTTYSLLKLIHPSIIAHNPQICFIEGGINDIHAGAPVWKVFSNLQRIVDTLKAYKIIPVIEFTFYTDDTCFNKPVDSLNNLLKGFADKNHLQTIDMNPVFSQNKIIKAQLTTDGVHLTGSAYKLWSAEISQKIRSVQIE